MGVHGSELIGKRFIGQEIEEVIPQLAELRIQVFRDFPYLYEGSLEYEKEYLKTYTNSKQSFLFAVFDGDKMVGATTCIPLLDETGEVILPFRESKLPLEKIFYFGESILLKPYRGLGYGKRFFQEREAHAKSLSGIEEVYFCGVRRPENHPLRPSDYQPLDPFWLSQGYKKKEGLVSYFSWLDIGKDEEDEKPMDYWFKKI